MILAGHSAGANSILTYAFAYPEKPIVRGLIAMSGGTPTTNPTSSPLFHNLAQSAGCADLNATAELACMQNIDALVLKNKVDEANSDPYRGLFRPIADNVTAFANVTERLEKGLIAKLVCAISPLSLSPSDEVVLVAVRDARCRADLEI
jgi:carboxylesterase type B